MYKKIITNMISNAVAQKSSIDVYAMVDSKLELDKDDLMAGFTYTFLAKTDSIISHEFRAVGCIDVLSGKVSITVIRNLDTNKVIYTEE